jgi:hypothetical protein
MTIITVERAFTWSKELRFTTASVIVSVAKRTELDGLSRRATVVNSITFCRCGHRRMTHTALKSNCTHGHHPNRNEPGWDEYREKFPECPCKEFEENNDDA